MSLSEVVSQELEQARSICSTYGETDPHCRAAWDAVEEVLAARSHKAPPTSLDIYCEEYPEAPECLIYED
ncbi:MAG: Calvin cycle protein CP12 [Cyanobacteria bacterium P01_G01_bin.4]